jgi:hypothetical protein
MNDRKLPMPGDVQIRVDDHPAVTITPADTPDAWLPPSTVPNPSTGNPTVDGSIASTMRVTRAQILPYRVVGGDKAKSLLREVVTGHRAIWRSVTMMPAADRGPAEIQIEGLREALSECGVDLGLPP